MLLVGCGLWGLSEEKATCRMKVGVLSCKENVEHPHSQWGYQKRNPGVVQSWGYYPLGRVFNASYGVSGEEFEC